jgi:peroxiredoxin (alkyl hydroperoxide reductase subunit C)
LEVDALTLDGRFERLRRGALVGRWSVLFFYPKDFTFVCPTEIHGYEALAPRFRETDAVLLGASVDSVHVHRAWVEHGLGKVSFPLMGDVTRRLTHSFGVLLEDEGVAARATFLLDPEGQVASVTANALDVGRSAAETLRLVQAFQAGGLTACEWQPGDRLLVLA